MRLKDIAFKVEPYSVSYSMKQRIRTQIQYYFSLRNLITDHFLRNIINTNKGGWADIQIISTFKQIHTLFSQHFQNATEAIKRIIVKKACEESEIVEVNNIGIRRKEQSINVKDFSSVLYLQGNIEVQYLKKRFLDFELQEGQIGIRGERDWFFVEIIEKNTNKIEECFEILKKELEQIKIIGGNQFYNTQQEYAKLIGLKLLETPNRETEVKYKITPGRILPFSEMQEFKTAPKTKPIKPKGKNNLTRLPKMYVQKSKPKQSSKSIVKDQLIQLEGFEMKSLKRTPEEIMVYRRKKIQEKKRKKAEKQENQKMEIEEPLIWSQP